MLMRLARPRTAVLFTGAVVACFVAFGVIYLSPITPPAVSQSAGGPTTAAFVLPFASLALIGGLIAVKRPENRMGWVILAAAASFGIGALCSLIGSLLFYAHNPAGAWVALGDFLWVPGVSPATFALAIALLSFPDGRLPSPRWRWLLYASAVFMVLTVATVFVAPQPGTLGIGYTSTVNPGSPLGVASLAGVTGAFMNSPITSIAEFVIEGIAVLSVFLRVRGADSERRHQVRWFASGAAVSVIAVAATGLLPNPGTSGAGAIAGVVVLALIGTLALPVAIAVALLKYRLYDIDLVINRALVYGVLAVFITAVYIGVAVGIGTLVGSGGKPNLGLSILATAIVAVGFQPLRHRMQRIANRLVYGKRATPYEALSDFSQHAAETYAADEVLPRMASVLRDGTGAERATVWLRSGDELRPAATSPSTTNGLHPVRVAAGVPPSIPGSDLVVLVENQGEMLGALTIVKRRGESLSAAETKLVDALANQAGLVLKNVALNAELLQRMDDLRESRQRLVHAQDEERRRLERNLHDGAQQHLVALKVKIGLAKMLAQRDPVRARATVVELQSDADDALQTLRDLARGIYPPLLAEKGLAVALESQAQRATVAVAVDAAGIGRYAQEVEATAYFCVLEALQNVQKYAQAAHALVRLRDSGAALSFDVEDDGAGYDPATVARGAGLTNMRDRIEAIGGAIDIDTAPGRGTAVRGRLPIAVAV